MRRLHLLVALGALGVTAVPACKKELKPEAKGHAPGPSVAPRPGPGAVPADTTYASGKVQVAVMQVETTLDLPSLGPHGEVGEEVRQAQRASALAQTLVVSEDRGKMVFNSSGFYIPLGTELRYKPAHGKYLLVDAAKRTYWTMSGGEVGNFLEGGPVTSRSNYSIAIVETPEKESVAGVEAVRSDVELGFDWAVTTKTGERKGRVQVKLNIWHSSDPKLKRAWSRMMLDFLTVPFQDPQGQGAVDELKRKIGFPVKWVMEVENRSQVKAQGEAHPRLLTTAQKLEVMDLDRVALASPPAGFEAATAPYEFGVGGQTVSADLLSKIPAGKGSPPRPEGPSDKDEE